MGRVVACINLSLDGVMQAPARPDEDRRGGFTHGGWATPYAAMAEAVGAFGSAGAMLLGRRTYEDFANVWPKRTDSPFTPWLNNTPKYVASKTLKEPLPWSNSILLKGDAADAVATLAPTLDKDLLILGSGALIRSLVPRGLISRFLLLIHPIVLGEGQRLFDDHGTMTTLQLVDVKPTAKGAVMATFDVASAR